VREARAALVSYTGSYRSEARVGAGVPCRDVHHPSSPGLTRDLRSDWEWGVIGASEED
jgi:hypothetical protein